MNQEQFENLGFIKDSPNLDGYWYIKAILNSDGKDTGKDIIVFEKPRNQFSSIISLPKKYGPFRIELRSDNGGTTDAIFDVESMPHFKIDIFLREILKVIEQNA